MANKLKRAAEIRKKLQAKTDAHMETRRKYQNENMPFEKAPKKKTRSRIATPGRSGIEAPRTQAKAKNSVSPMKTGERTRYMTDDVGGTHRASDSDTAKTRAKAVLKRMGKEKQAKK